MNDMEIVQQRQDAKLVLKITGRLDSGTFHDLQNVVDSGLEGVTELEMDMEGLEYMSSAGVRVLLSAIKKMKARKGVMAACNVNASVMDVLEITGLKNSLDIR